jgi:UDP-glucose 4-epimerase
VNRALKKYLITGGAGFIGSHLSELLLARGDEVTVLDDFSTGSIENISGLEAESGFNVIRGSVLDEELLDRTIPEHDVIVHLAAAVGVKLIINNPALTIESNVLGTHFVLRACQKYGKKIMLASTSEVYGKNDDAPFSEDQDSVLGPTTIARWAYAASKAVDEFLALAFNKQYGLPVVIFRLFNTIGPRQVGDFGMVVPSFVNKAIAGGPLQVFGSGSQTRCFCDVRDVVRAIALLEESDEAIGQVYNIGAEDEISIIDLAREVVVASGLVSEDRVDDAIEVISYDEAYEGGFEDMMRRVPNISKIRNAVGWQPEIKLAETLGTLIELRRESESAD